jgi:SAM-dependent methyltransferase
LKDIESRARQSAGRSSTHVYQMVYAALERRGIQGGTLLDVGCGEGNLWSAVSHRFDTYAGADIIRYEAFPGTAQFFRIDLASELCELAESSADVVAAVEIIEHLENPRAFARQLVRAARPGGWVVVTTPNQLSVLSKLSLLLKNQFNAFQDASYPAHLTALLESDLLRIAAECGLTSVSIEYSTRGRVPLTGAHFPRLLSGLLPREFSDNVLLIGQKAVRGGAGEGPRFATAPGTDRRRERRRPGHR